MSTRVRFAPSPTGYLHIGGLRTALYNYLLARGGGGRAVLRIEDTDRSRFVDDAEADLQSGLKWAGLEFDEGPGLGGDHGPYRQSERTSLYRGVADQLLEQGAAYIAFDTPEELEALRSRASAGDRDGGRYSAATRHSLRNSVSLTSEETRRLLDSGEPHVVRLMVPESETIAFEDLIRGRVSFNSGEVDDQVLLKSDGMPTYHLANVVDDHAMGITHVIRGEEWLSSTPKHTLLYRFLDWEMPKWAHLPLILSPTGGKLSKRSAEAQGIPVLVRDYRAAGYEPEALINYIALLGWNPGTEQEIFDLEGLSRAFSLERVGSSGVQFSLEKLRWFNGQHLRRMGLEDLRSRVRAYLPADGVVVEDAYLDAVLELMRERITLASDVAAATYFFQDPDSYDERGVAKRWKPDSAELLAGYADRLETHGEFSAAEAETVLRRLADERGVGAGRIIHPTRLALTGATMGPGLFELMHLLGRERCVRRIRSAVSTLSRVD